MKTASYRYARILMAVLAILILSAPAFAGHHGSAKAPKKGILLVAFGTSMPEAQVAFENIDKQVHAAFPEIPVRWAFTSNIIREKLLREEGRETLSVQSALAKMMDEGFTEVAVQSLHTIPGEEFHLKVLSVVNAFRGLPGGFDHIVIGAPLMATPEDMDKVTGAVLSTIPAKRHKTDAVILMGHGTHHAGNIYYPGLQWYLSKKDSKVFVGTVEGIPSLEDIETELKGAKVKKVWLMPLMSVAGDHARNDMAGPEEDSWKSILTAKGYKVETVLKGTAEYSAYVSIWLDHLRAAVNKL